MSETYNVNSAFDPEARQAQADFDAYMASRPYKDGRGNVHNPDTGDFINHEDYSQQHRDAHYEATQQEGDYSGESLEQLAQRVAAARAEGDKTRASDAEDAFFKKFAAYSAKYGWENEVVDDSATDLAIDKDAKLGRTTIDDRLKRYTAIMYGEEATEPGSSPDTDSGEPTPTEATSDKSGAEPEPTPEPLGGDETEGAGTDDTSGGAAPTEPKPGDNNPTGTETAPEVKIFGIFNSDMSIQEAVERAIQHLDACKPEDIAASYDTLSDDMQHLVLYHKGEGTPDWSEPARALANFKTPVREYYEQKKSKPKASRAEAPAPIPSGNKESSSATVAPVAEAKPTGGPAAAEAAENTSWRERVAVVRKGMGRAAIGVRSGLQDFWTWLKDQESETAASAEGLEEFEKLKAQLTPDAMRTRLQSSAQGRDYIFAAIERVGKLGREHATDWPQDAIREAQQGALLDRLKDIEESLKAEQPSA